MKLLLLAFAAGALVPAADLRIGIIGTDTSHVGAFTAILNDPANKNHIPGARIVAAFKGGSADLESSSSRVDKYAEEIAAKFGVEIVPSIAALLPKVDAILLESVDGRKHLPQFREIMKAGKPIFIDKPLASTYADALEIARLGRENNVRWFSASSLRFSGGIPALKQPGTPRRRCLGTRSDRKDPSARPLLVRHSLRRDPLRLPRPRLRRGHPRRRAPTATPSPVAGATAASALSSSTTITPASARPPSPSAKSLVSSADFYTGYQDLIVAIIKFFQGGPSPVDEKETLEMFAFMDAAQRSKESGGKPVPLK